MRGAPGPNTVPSAVGTTLAAHPRGAANDTDAHGDALAATVSTAPANGTLALNGDGSFTDTPDPGFVGPDSFTLGDRWGAGTIVNDDSPPAP